MKKDFGPILVGCEESQTVCGKLRAAGFEAYSCDILPTRGNPDWHILSDVVPVISTRKWGLIVLHPDCTAMAVSGNRWYGEGMPLHERRLAAIEWTANLWELAKEHSPRVALENPVSVIFDHIPNVHYLQPWQFGHGETKKTGFALYGLDPLVPTEIVSGRANRVWMMPPSATRKRDRSQTFEGVAAAIADQWTRPRRSTLFQF